ncbi:CHAD domain-containing protein [Roseovarius atlanticus]|uniref:CHAD domain-containing protein n=1 Tax=Roseovarius atlanticus TaxID=1641875 RepID=UPI00070E629F|nr:CHAD domain-containing protein [Roseovarius atlanticus]
MSFHFEPHAPLQSEVRRIAEDQLNSALAATENAREDPEDAVHDLRKRMKKLRGLARLVRPGLGDTYSRENRRFRDVARLFSPIRDAQVLYETLDGLQVMESAAGQDLAPVKAWAQARRNRILTSAELDDRLATARTELRDALAGLDAWQIDDPAEDVLRKGLKKTYKRACERYAFVQHTPGPDPLHEWRKRVKYHWYHLRLLREGWPDIMAPQIIALDRLGDLLGDDHDLVVLIDTLEAEDAPDSARNVIARCAADQSHSKRRSAFALAPYLMLETPKALSRRIAGYWAAVSD